MTLNQDSLMMRLKIMNISKTIDDQLGDLAPFYSHEPDKSIQYDFFAMQNALQDKICNRIFRMESIFVDSVPRGNFILLSVMVIF